MGTKRKHKEGIAIKHLNSNLNIKSIQCCNDCSLKIYAKENETITYGVGNIFGNIVFVLPNYDVNAKIGYNTLLNLLQTQYKELTSKEIFEDYYVTRVVKCYNKTDFDLESQSVKHCYTNLVYEISRIKPNKVIFLTKDYEYLIDYMKILFNNNSNIKFYQTYNIGVLYYESEYKDKFVEQLKEIIYDT